MKKILITITATLMLVSVGYCQDQPLQLIVKVDKEIYEVGDPIDLELSIKNIGNKTIRIYSPDYWGVSEIVVTNSQGFILKPRGAKVERRSFDSFMVIPPQESRNHIFYNLEWFHCGGAWLFADDAQLPPGRYQIYVIVTNPPVDKCNSGKRFEKTDLSAMVASNTISIEVIAKNETADYPASGLASKAKSIAEDFMSRQYSKSAYEAKASSIQEFDDYVDCYFKRKIPIQVKGDGLVRVNKRTWKAEWIGSE